MEALDAAKKGGKAFPSRKSQLLDATNQITLYERPATAAAGSLAAGDTGAEEKTEIQIKITRHSTKSSSGSPLAKDSFY